MGDFVAGIIVGWLPSMFVLAWMLWRVPVQDPNN